MRLPSMSLNAIDPSRFNRGRCLSYLLALSPRVDVPSKPNASESFMFE